jgi:prepilin-type N-terminal cleavage/methylation domain-containing protein
MELVYGSNKMKNFKFSILNFQLSGRGFTLVEMLITMAIVSILSTTSVIGYRAQIQKADDGARKKELVKIKTALEDYYSSNNCYPAALPACGQGLEPYLPQMPCEPDGKTSFRYTPQEDTTCPQYYRLYTKLGNTSDPVISQAGCTSGCGPDSAYNWGVSSDNVALEAAPGASPSPSPPSPSACLVITACFGKQCNNITSADPNPCPTVSFCNDDCSGGCIDDSLQPILEKQCR